MNNPQFEILNLSADGLNAIAPLLDSSAFKPVRFLAKELGAGLTDLWSRSLADLLAGSASQGFLALRDGAPLGLLVYSDNPWETNLLGKKAATIQAFMVDGSLSNKLQVSTALLDHALQSAAANGVQFLLGKTYTDDLTIIHALESRGFLLMDTVVDCSYDYRRVPFASLPSPVVAENVTMRLATLDDRDEIVAVARQAFHQHFGRFHSDERISRQVATQAYEQWMRSSLDGYADWIHLALVSGRIAGFSTWKRPSKAESQIKGLRLGHFSIAGIHPDYHGQGLFKALTYAGMQSMHGIVDVIDGPTHVNNYPVQIGFAKIGWHVLSDARHSFHKWLDAE